MAVCLIACAAMFCEHPPMPGEISILPLRPDLAAQRSEIAAERIVSGRPEVSVCNQFEDPTHQFFAGIWTATPGSWRVRYTEYEFCHLLRGRVALTSESGQRWEFSAGESFVVPAGFKGVWEVLEECRKLYAVFEPHG